MTTNRKNRPTGIWLELWGKRTFCGRNSAISSFGSTPAPRKNGTHSGKNYGWGFRLKDRKRAILYLTPCDDCFKASLVFGEKATKEALAGDISDGIKKIIESARVYAEGRGFRVEVTGPEIVADIKKLILIKLAN